MTKRNECTRILHVAVVLAQYSSSIPWDLLYSAAQHEQDCACKQAQSHATLSMAALLSPGLYTAESPHWLAYAASLYPGNPARCEDDMRVHDSAL